MQNVGIRRRTKLEAGDLIARKNECVVCRSIFRPRRGWKETTNLKRKTCSDKCYKELMSILTIGKNNPNWKDGSSQTYYQRITRETKPQICEIEGCGNINDVETHHIDRDRTNNSPENTRILCGKHHAMLHYIEDTRGLNGELSGEEKEQLLYKKMIP